MAAKNKIQRSAGELKDVEESTKAVLNAVFDHLKNSAAVKTDGAARLFFPNGIELLSLTVGIRNLVEVTIKIAGDKNVGGKSPAEIESIAANPEPQKPNANH